MHGGAADMDRGFSIPQRDWEGIARSLGLAPREAEVLKCVLEDQRERDIALTLGLSFHTVRTYLKRLRVKLGVSSRVQLVKRVFAGWPAWVATSHPPVDVAQPGDLS